MRYCLEPTADGGGERLWFQTTSASSAFDPASVATCPGASGWETQTVVAGNIVNRVGGADRPVFGFGCSSSVPAGATCHTDPATHFRILSARVSLMLDVNAADRAPAATKLASAVYLRNQNEPPTVSFVATSGGPRTVTLNGSGSDDPEGRTLRFEWFEGTAVPAPACAGGPVEQGAFGEGLTFTHRFDEAVVAAQAISLRVTDPGCLYAVSAPRSIDPGTGGPVP